MSFHQGISRVSQIGRGEEEEEEENYLLPGDYISRFYRYVSYEKNVEAFEVTRSTCVYHCVTRRFMR